MFYVVALQGDMVTQAMGLCLKRMSVQQGPKLLQYASARKPGAIQPHCWAAADMQVKEMRLVALQPV